MCCGLNLAVSTGFLEATIDRGFPKSLILVFALVWSPLRRLDSKRRVVIFVLRGALVASEFISTKTFMYFVSLPPSISSTFYYFAAAILVIATGLEMRDMKANEARTQVHKDIQTESIDGPTDEENKAANDIRVIEKRSESDITAKVMTGDDDVPSLHDSTMPFHDSKETQTPAKTSTSRLLKPKKIKRIGTSPSRILSNLKSFNSPGRQEVQKSPALKSLKFKGTRNSPKLNSPGASQIAYRTRSVACFFDHSEDMHVVDIKVD